MKIFIFSFLLFAYSLSSFAQEVPVSALESLKAIYKFDRKAMSKELHKKAVEHTQVVDITQEEVKESEDYPGEMLNISLKLTVNSTYGVYDAEIRCHRFYEDGSVLGQPMTHAIYGFLDAGVSTHKVRFDHRVRKGNVFYPLEKTTVACEVFRRGDRYTKPTQVKNT